jgi:hypothetical protein
LICIGLSLSLPLFVLGFSTKTTRDGSIMDLGAGAGGGRGKKKEGRMMMIAAGGRQRTDGWMDGGDAAEQNKSVW